MGNTWKPADLQAQINAVKTAGWMVFFKKAALAVGIKLAILLAIASRETGCRNIKGDGGHGRGVCQIDDRSWGDFLIAHKDGMDPESNIRKAADILAANLKALGDMEKALCAYNCGAGNVRRALANHQDPNARTAGGDYGRDVLARSVVIEGLLAAEIEPNELKVPNDAQ